MIPSYRYGSPRTGRTIISLLFTIVPLLMASLSAGCGGSASRAVRTNPDDSLSGAWLMEINSNDIGYVRTVMTIERTGNAFEGHSREGAAGDILGWWDLFMAKLFTDYFKHGALLHLRSGQVTSDSMGAILISALSPLRVQGKLEGETLRGILTRREKELGRIIGSRSVPSMPLDNYPAIVERVVEVTEGRIYNRRLLQQSPWRSFKEDLRELATSSQDDLDLIFGFFHYGSELPFSHYNLYRKTDDPGLQINSQEEPQPLMKLNIIPGKAAHLVIASFSGEGGEIDGMFERIRKENLPALIIDLRGNAGGNISAMRVVSNLIDTAVYGGVFVTNKWFEQHSEAPAVSQYGSFPMLSEANLDLLFKGIHEQEGLSLKAVSSGNPYRGKVFVLTDRYTASSCEPLVYGIKQYRLGTVVGERTAGAMLNGEEFPVAAGWYVTVPTAEYYAADGYRIDGVGVAPDIEVKGEAALDYVLKSLAD